MYQLSLLSGALVFGMMTALWLLSLALKDSSIVDSCWGAGFVLIDLAGLSFSHHTARQILLTVLVSVWGLRLSIYIFLRNRGKPEDFRYTQWRRENGRRWWWVSFFKVFALQGLLLWIIAVPLVAVQASDAADSYTLFDALGVTLWAIGFFFEAVGDYQLARFKANPSQQGKVMTAGLWRYTRHPNYFGDAVQWWGFYLLAAASGGWWTIFSPALMTGLLLRVSGVTLLEKSLKTRDGYEEYMRRTNAFFPWIPRRS